jgi:hypothetical protein
MMKPLLTILSFPIIFHAVLAAGTTNQPAASISYPDNGTQNQPQTYKDSLDYILLAYDIVDVFTDEDVMNLEHDDNNRKLCT